MNQFIFNNSKRKININKIKILMVYNFLNKLSKQIFKKK